ncbi:hypothetical protein ABK040_004868 [Willaertia magna]
MGNSTPISESAHDDVQKDISLFEQAYVVPTNNNKNLKRESIPTKIKQQENETKEISDKERNEMLINKFKKLNLNIANQNLKDDFHLISLALTEARSFKLKYLKNLKIESVEILLRPIPLSLYNNWTSGKELISSQYKDVNKEMFFYPMIALGIGKGKRVCFHWNVGNLLIPIIEIDENPPTLFYKKIIDIEPNVIFDKIANYCTTFNLNKEYTNYFTFVEMMYKEVLKMDTSDVNYIYTFLDNCQNNGFSPFILNLKNLDSNIKNNKSIIIKNGTVMFLKKEIDKSIIDQLKKIDPEMVNYIVCFERMSDREKYISQLKKNKK